MKALKHINFCLFLLLAVLFTQNSIVRAAITEKRLTTKKERKNLRTNTSKISTYINNYQIKEALKNPAPIESLNLRRKSAPNFQIKEKTFIETLPRIIYPIISALMFLSMIFSAFSKKSTTEEKFPMFSFLVKKISGFGKSTARVKRPPASFLAKVADLLPKKHRESFKQEISDMRLEYYEALNEKKIWRAKCIIVFYHIGLCWSVVMWISDKGKEAVGIIPKKN